MIKLELEYDELLILDVAVADFLLNCTMNSDFAEKIFQLQNKVEKAKQSYDSSLPVETECTPGIEALETSSETVPQTQTDKERLVELLRDFGIPEDFWDGFEQIGNTVVLEHGDGLIGLKCDFNFDSGGAFKSWGVWE